MKISIITATWNSAVTIENAILSVASQGYPDLEHIIVDGNSSDATLPIIFSHADRIDKLISEPDHGIYDAMNKGISVATGDVIGILRRYFLYDRKLLADLSRCAWESLKVFLQEAVPEKDPDPGAVIAVQTFGDLIGHNPHCHILVTDGCFYGNKDMFRVAPPLELKKLEAIFQHKVKSRYEF
jgi:glycosyltransferase involved in cell wall biosynthesis